MKDQAENLRNHTEMHHAKFIAIMSGKGGVGKSIFSLNYALSISKSGFKVLLIDFDIGMGNIDVLLGQSASHSIVDVLINNISLATVTEQGPFQLDYIGGGSALNQSIQFDRFTFEKFQKEFDHVQKKYDLVIFDMGAGINLQYIDVLLSMDEIFIVTTYEPTSIMDAYSMVKFLLLKNHEMYINVIMNRSTGHNNSKEFQKRLKNTVQQFLKKEIQVLGSIPDDKYVVKSVLEQEPLVIKYPTAAASIAIHKIASRQFGLTYVPRKLSFLERFKKRLLN